MKYLAVHFNDSELSDNEILIDKHVRLVDDESIIQLDEFEVGCNVAILEKVHYLTISTPVISHLHILNVAEYEKDEFGNYYILAKDGEEFLLPILGEIKFYKDKQ